VSLKRSTTLSSRTHVSFTVLNGARVQESGVSDGAAFRRSWLLQEWQFNSVAIDAVTNQTHKTTISITGKGSHGSNVCSQLDQSEAISSTFLVHTSNLNRRVLRGLQGPHILGYARPTQSDFYPLLHILCECALSCVECTAFGTPAASHTNSPQQDAHLRPFSTSCTSAIRSHYGQAHPPPPRATRQYTACSSKQRGCDCR